MIPHEAGLLAAPALLLGADQWLEGLEGPAWLVDAGDWTVRLVNRPALAWLGLGPERCLGQPAEALLPGLEDQVFWAELRAGQPGQLASDTEVSRPQGLAQVHRRIVPLGEPARAYLVTLQDRSHEARAASERETLLAELRATLESTADGILVLDTAGRIRAFNRRFAQLWDLPEAALAEPADATVLDWMRRSVLQPDAYQQRVDEINAQLLVSGTDTVALLNGRLLERYTQPQWSQGRPIGRVYSFRELARSRATAPASVGASGLDGSTGWPNRHRFLEALDEAVLQARDDGQPLAVLVVEFDRHALFAAEGSARARGMDELVEALRATVREPAQIGRLGASRFAVLLRPAGESAAEALARRLVQLATRPGPALLATAGLKVHVGGAVYPQAGWCGEELLQHAEKALQRARGAGVAGWELHRGSTEQVHEGRRQQRLEQAVREGLSSAAFRLQFQARFASATGEIQAMEALLRWQDPQEGLMLPPRFMPLAERAGLMRALDDWALEQAVQQAVAWERKGWHQALTVNVSGETLAEPACARRVAAVLAHAGWPARQLELDITEAALRRDPEAALSNLDALHRLGVRLVLDDWGLDDCALGWLRRVPFTAVKIDRRLLRAVPDHGAEADLVRGLTQVARAMGLQVLAEGVEHEAQRRFVTDTLGCQGWQGLLGSAALDPRACERVLARQASQAAALTGTDGR